MGMIIPENFESLLEPGLREVFFEGMTEVASNYQKVCKVFDSTKSTEIDQGLVEMGQWDERSDGEILALDEMKEGYETSYSHVTYKKGTKVTRDMLEDDQYGQIREQVMLLGRGAQETVERKVADIFNNAFDDSVSGGDGVGLCSDVHPYADPDFVGATQDNEETEALSPDSLKAARTAFLKQRNAAAQPMIFSPILNLIVPVDLAENAEVLIGSDKRPGGNDNDLNTAKNRYNLIVLPYLASSTAWFLQDPALHRVKFFWRVKPDFRQAEKIDTDSVVFRGRMRFSCGWSDWRGIWGSTGTA